jgi:hypothetical protein
MYESHWNQKRYRVSFLGEVHLVCLTQGFYSYTNPILIVKKDFWGILSHKASHSHN